MRLEIPLLADHHSHPFLYAGLMDGVDLGSDATLKRAEAVARIRERAEANAGAMTIAYGWHAGRYALEPSDFRDLPPVVVLNVSLHGLILNDAAREVVAETDPELTFHLDDPPWLERNLQRTLTGLARSGATADRLNRFFRHLLEVHGVWSVEEMLLAGADEIRLFDEAGLSDRTRFWAAPEVYEALPSDLQSRVHGIKLFTDGAIGARTAALGAPYRDGGGGGLLMYSNAEFEAVVKHYLHRDVPLAVHAIGDRAIDQLVGVLDRLHPNSGAVRIEHAQFISESTARRAKTLGIVLCMQPNFSDDSVHYAARLPAGHPERNNLFRMLIDRVGFVPGQDLLFGSDGMPHGAAEGLRQSLFPPFPGQILTVEEFIEGYCVADRQQGHIEVDIDSERSIVHTRTITPT